MTFNKRKNSSTEAKLTNFYFVQLSQYLLLILLLCVQCKSAEGEFIEMPKDSTVIVTQSTFFNCSRSGNQTNEPIWYHHPVNGNRRDVYDFGIITSKYEGRFDIDKNATSGSFNLLVNRPEPADAGRYECVENVDLDRGPSAELTVLDENVACESDKDPYELVGSTACNQNMTHDQLQLMCIVSYSGNFRPQLQWRAVGNAVESLETKCNESGINSVMCNATLEYSLNMTESAYICEMIAAPQYNCSWKVSKIIYALPYNSVKTITTSMEEVCSANTSMGLLCSYKWLKDNTTVQLGDRLKPSEPGRYTCEALCIIRNEPCAFTAMAVDVSKSGTGVNRGLLVGLLVMALIAIGIVAGLMFRTWKKKRTPNSADETQVRFRKIEGEQSADQPHEKQPDQQRNHQTRSGAEDENDALLADVNDETNDGDLKDVVVKACNADNRFIGPGLNGSIFRVRYKGENYVCEQIRTTEAATNEQKKICIKYKEWAALDHGNLLKFCHIIQNDRVVYIVKEFPAGGSVRDALSTYLMEQEIEMSAAVNWATQIADGMNYLNTKGITHKDIRSDQIFIMEASGSEKKTFKIGCFNLLGDDAKHEGTTDKIKYSSSSPEAYTRNDYSEKSCVWSFGIVVWEILTKKRPYADFKSKDEVIKDIAQGAPTLALEIPEKYKELTELLRNCWLVDPGKRPTLANILGYFRIRKQSNEDALLAKNTIVS